MVAQNAEVMTSKPFLAAAAFGTAFAAPLVALADEGASSSVDEATLIPLTLGFLGLVVTMTVTFTISIWLGFGAKN